MQREIAMNFLIYSPYYKHEANSVLVCRHIRPVVVVVVVVVVVYLTTLFQHLRLYSVDF
jgi:hypothetical protein